MDVHRPVYIDPDQLPLFPEDPQPGDRYRSTHTRTIATVVKVDQRRFAWVTLRVRGELQTVTLAKLQEHWTRI